MTTTMKMVLASFSVSLVFGAAAEGPAISDVTVRQRWPWSKLVDIDYVLSGTTQNMDIALSAFNGPNPLPLTAASLTGDLYGVSDGAHRIVWDPTVTACTNLGVLGQFRVALAPSPSPLYMVIDLSGGTSATSYPVSNYFAEADVPGGVTSDVYKTTSLLMRRLPATSKDGFKMGSPGTESYRDSTREDLHDVVLTKGFYVGVYEITQSQWQQVMGDKRSWPSYWSNNNYRLTRPVERVSYYDIRENWTVGTDTTGGSAIIPSWPQSVAVGEVSFMGRLRAKTGLLGFDLPTDAQWEYACRAETTGALNDGTVNITNSNSDARLDMLGRYLYNGGKVWNGSSWVDPEMDCTSANATAAVGSYAPNAWGLYDMHGNVFEWCRDWSTNRLGTVAVTDPAGADTSISRVMRGGCWNNTASFTRSAFRYSFGASNRNNGIGFRLFCSLP